MLRCEGNSIQDSWLCYKSQNIWADEVGEEWQGWREEYGRRSKRVVTASDKPPFTLRGSNDTASARPASGCGPSDLPVCLSCHPRQTSASAAPWGPGAVLTGACSCPLMHFASPHDGVEKSMWDRLWFVICNSKALELNTLALCFLSPLRGHRGLVNSVVGDFLGPQVPNEEYGTHYLPG